MKYISIPSFEGGLFPFLLTRPCKVQGWVETEGEEIDRHRANIWRRGIVRSTR